MNVRSWGPFLALTFPSACALLGVGLLAFVTCEDGCIGIAAVSLFFVILAAPTVAIFGWFVPDSWLVLAAVLTSIPLWLLLGRWLADRAATADNPWRVWWGSYGRSIGLVMLAVLIAALLFTLIGRL